MKKRANSRPILLMANAQGEVVDVPDLHALGRLGRHLRPIDPADLIPMPRGSELYFLPERVPLGIRHAKQSVRTVSASRRRRSSPPNAPIRSQRDRRGEPGAWSLESQEGGRAVAAFLPSGYSVFALAAYDSLPQATLLPLFSYAAVCWYRNGFHVPAMRIERDVKHDPDQFSPRKLASLVASFGLRHPKNRLVEHLAENCALRYGCANAKNLFYARWECPIPLAPACNASCIGCISAQPDAPISPPQDRLSFVPSIQDVLDIVVPHLRSAPEAMVSFGQGCEGEPLLQADLMREIIRAIRQRTQRGTIHLNTNGSRPDVVESLAAAGLDSIRVSLNSAQPQVYARYYRPRLYSFDHVADSIRIARQAGLFTSINYLSFPGLTDSPPEIESLTRLIESSGLNMIQWRNLNIDPDAYCDSIGLDKDLPAMGMRSVLDTLKRSFPAMRHGYVNPPRERWQSVVE